jgi:catechol 2,3-dioxygenase-like lactoylglutathione lyase family enzyme
MLSNLDATANVAVKNLETAKKFYAGTLGLKQVASEGDEVVVYKSGNTMLNVYRSDFAGTNKATAVTWAVADVYKEVAELKAKGVRFEHYDDMQGLERDGDVYSAGGKQVAWFKDPDGNILNLIHTEGGAS